MGIVRYALVSLLFLIPPFIRGQEKDPPPTFTVQVRSLDDLGIHFRLGMELVGREDLGRHVEGLIKTRIGTKGLEGIDPKKPFGAYGRISNDLDQLHIVVLMPLANEQTFLTYLKGINLQAKKGKDDVYLVKTETPLDLYFRIAQGYVYVTALNPAILTKLVEPKEVFTAASNPALAGSFRVDQIPLAFKKIFLFDVDKELMKAQEMMLPGETELQKAFRVYVLKELGDYAKALIEEGGNLNLELETDRNQNELTLTLNLTGQEKSNLAEAIKTLQGTKSTLAGLGGRNVALRYGLHVPVPEKYQKTLEAAFGLIRLKTLADFKEPVRKKEADQFFQALEPTIKAGEIDAIVSLLGPDANLHFTLLAGLKLKEGDKLARTVRSFLDDLLKNLGMEEKDRIKLAVENIGGVEIHRFDYGGKFDARSKEMFGANPIHLAIRNDAVLLSLGPDGDKAIREALTRSVDAPQPTLQFEVALASLVPFLAKTDQQKDAVAQVFPKGDDGRVRITLEGGPTLKLKLATRLTVVTFFTRLMVAGKGKAEGK